MKLSTVARMLSSWLNAFLFAGRLIGVISSPVALAFALVALAVAGLFFLAAAPPVFANPFLFFLTLRPQICRMFPHLRPRPMHPI